MGIGKTDNYKFYEGYEDEPEIEFSTNDENMETLHIWDGFFWIYLENPHWMERVGMDLRGITISAKVPLIIREKLL